MPFFPLAGGEVVVLILVFAIFRWISRSWWRGELGDETLLRWLPRREPPPPPERAEPPKLRLIRGGLDERPSAETADGRRA